MVRASRAKQRWNNLFRSSRFTNRTRVCLLLNRCLNHNLNNIRLKSNSSLSFNNKCLNQEVSNNHKTSIHISKSNNSHRLTCKCSQCSNNSLRLSMLSWVAEKTIKVQSLRQSATRLKDTTFTILQKWQLSIMCLLEENRIFRIY